jgi:AcrR family transcriptional regulator
MKTSLRKDQIRLKAQTLFRERGYAATSMRDLAEGLGIEAASLYNHISSKEEILQDICFAMAESFFATVEPIALSHLGPSEKLSQCIEAHLKVISESLDAAAVFQHEWRHMGEPYLSDFKLMRRRYEQMFRRLIDEGIVTGAFRNVDSVLAARTLLSAANWTYEWMKPTGKFQPAEITNVLIPILMYGICNSPAIESKESEAQNL